MPKSSQYRNLLLGLSASAGSHDLHFGAFILAASRLNYMLPTDFAEATAIDDRIEALTREEDAIVVLDREEVEPGEAIGQIARTLAGTCGNLHFIAHDLILAVCSMSALGEIGCRVDGRLVEGICGNITGMAVAPPGIFHGADQYEIRARETAYEAVNPPPGETELVARMMGLLRGIRFSCLGFGYRAQEYHVLTHTHALIWLKRNGFDIQYARALNPWILRMDLLGAIKDADGPEFRRADFAPFAIGDGAFWKKVDGRHGDRHAFKAALALLEMKSWGVLTEGDAGFLLERKFPYWFSPAENEF